jgi:hypothetical protein
MTSPARPQRTPAAPAPSAARSRLTGFVTGRPEIDWGARSDRRTVYLLVVMCIAVGGLLMWTARGTTFFYDEWEFVVNRYNGGLASFLDPHNEHISIVPVAIYKVLFHLVGMRDYQIYRLVLVVLHLICVGLIYDIARRRIGAWPALVVAVSILCLFTAWEDLIWAFQISFVGSIVGGVAAWALLDRNRRSCDIAAAVALTIALGSSGLGLPFVPGLIAEIAMQRRWRRLWVVAIPFALYVLWYTQYGVNMVTSNTVIQSPQWILEAVAAGFGALAGRDTDWGVPLAVLGFALAARRIANPATRLSPRLIGAALTGLAYWVLVGVSRSTIQPPDTSRYTYLSAVCIVVIAVELFPSIRPNGRMICLAAFALLAAALMGWQTMHNNALTLRQTSATVAAQLGAMTIEQSRTPATFAPSGGLAPNITAGPYFLVAREMGSSAADSPAAILAAPTSAQMAADAVLIALVAPSVQSKPLPVAGATPPVFDSAVAAKMTHSGSCVTVRPTGGGAAAAFTLPPGGAYIRNESAAPVALSMRRFSAGFTPINQSVAAHASDTLVVATDSSSLPWYLEFALPGKVAVCGLTR